jgi:hypothetical protein
MTRRAIPDDTIITIYEYASRHDCSAATAARALGHEYTGHELNWRAGHLRRIGVAVPVLDRNPGRRAKLPAPEAIDAPAPVAAAAAAAPAEIEPDPHALRPVAWAVEVLGLSLAAAAVIGRRCPVMPESAWRRVAGRCRP